MSDKLNEPCVNTDRELWREPPGDYYASSIHVTESGGVGINVGGHVIVMPLRAWHEAAKEHAAAEERGRRKGVEAAKELAGAAECLLRFRDPWDSASRSDWQRYREALARIEDLELRTFAPRDSGPQTQCKHGKPGVKCDRCPWCWSVKCPGTEVPRDPGKEGCK